ncbi:tandem-95 repeat protein [Shewanella sp. D64]|uniref:tandem-95 repeat protein n=1 Tax=unclassified Shewanella TaxID=196818 RepID=UPI0022BA25D7|nr:MULTISPECIES: tandem-95 repeat protein [unclassified Shewanella]MEC4726955.1 tandem-95 repeat protein [Shewanella sp. D64]MEC4738548.1 tandem-95 repeat protein [Shewanella sp. E94]WBJ93766.1 tandem-95 repeat protein [Shewanella sp. MTB7]
MNRLSLHTMTLIAVTIFSPWVHSAADVDFIGVVANANLGQPYIHGDFTFDQDVSGGGAEFIGIIGGGAIGNVDGGLNSNIVTFKTTDGSEFSLVSFQLESAAGDDIYLVSAYKDGTILIGESWNLTGQYGSYFTFTPTSTLFNDTDEIRISNNDNSIGFIVVNLDNIDVDVAVPPNSAPITANFNGDSFSYTEGDGTQTLDQGTSATLTDADSANLNDGNLTLTITSGKDATEDLLSIDTSGSVTLAGITAGNNVSITGPGVVGTLGNNIAAGNDFVINLNATATPAHLQTLVRALTYQNSDIDNPTTGARNIRLTVNDGDGGTSANADITVTVAGSNDAPVLTNLSGDSLNYNEGDGAKLIDQAANASLNDVDSSDFNTGNLSVSIITNKDAAEDILGFDNSVTTSGGAGDTVTISATNVGTLANSISAGNDLVVNFTNNANPALIQALIRSVTYTNSDNLIPTQSTRTVRFTVSDGDGGTSSNNDTSVIVSQVNGAPLGSNKTLTPNQASILPLTTSDFSYSDPEGDTLNRITIINAPASGSLWVDLDASNSINNAESALTSSDTVTKANLDASLLKYSPSGSTSTNFTFTVNDGSADSASNYTITLTVNAQPTVTINQASGQSDPTNNATVTFDVVFNESISGFDITDIDLSGDVTANVTSVSASSGTGFTVTTNINANEGDIIAQIIAGGVTDASGATNQPSTSTDNTIEYDISAPASPSGLDLVISSDSGNSDSDNLTSDTTPEISGNGETGASITLFSDIDHSGTLNGSEASVTTSVSTGTWSVSMPTIASTSHSLKAFQTDPAGNASPVSATLTIEIDTVAPSGHGAVIDQDPINNGNQDSVSFTFTAGEVSSNYSYTLTSSGGGTPLTGTGTLSTAIDTITNIDVSSLTDGTLTLSTILTDAAGNSAAAVNDTSVKDSSAPNGHDVSIDQALILTSNDNALSFTFSGAESGANFVYTINSSGGGSINGTGSLTTVNDTISNIDMTSLSDGVLTLSVVVTDINGNAATAVIDTVNKDALGPVIQSVGLNTGNIKADETILVSVQFDDIVILSGSNSTATLSIGGISRTAVYTSGHNTSSLDFSYTVISGDNDSDGVTLTSVQGNSDTAKDANGNDVDFSFTAFTEANLLVDTQTPVVATPLQASQTVNADTLTLSQNNYPEDGITVIALSDSDGNGIADNNTPLASITSNSGSWSLTLNLSQNADNYFILRTTDQAGNMTDTAIGNYLEDSIAPDDAIILSPIAHVYQSTNTITIQGSQSENGVSVSLYSDADNNGVADSNTAVASSVVVANSWNIALTLSDNTNANYVVIAQDDAGNSAQAVDLVTLTHDNINPIADITIVTSLDNTPTLRGSVTDAGGIANLSFTLEASDNTIFGPFDADSFSDINSGEWLDSELASTLIDDSYDAHLSPIDLAGNTQILTISDAIRIDTISPNGYSIEIEQDRIDTNNESALSFIITGGNIGESFIYQISDGSSSVTGSGTINISNNSNSQTISNIDVSSLNEGTLTLTLSLTDIAGNQGLNVTDSLNKFYNLAPVITQGNTITVTMSEDATPTPFSLNLTASDQDGDSLNWQITSGTNKGAALLQVSGYNTTVSYLPTANFNGNDSLTVQVSDGSLTSQITINIVITAVNDAPRISGNPITSISEDIPFNFAPVVSDIDSTLLSCSISGLPTWASFNTVTGVLSGTPTNANVGTHEHIIITVKDNLGAIKSLPSFSITVTNVNDAPVISGSPASSVDEDSLYSFTPTMLDADSDDTHQFSISNKPDWANFNNSNGTLSGTPVNENIGTSSNIIISVTDSANATASLSVFSIEVNNTNDVPVLHTSELEAKEDSELLFSLNISDDDNDELTLTLVTQPQHGSLNTSGSLWRYQADTNYHGDDNFTILINDEETSSEPIEVSINVLPVNDAPQAHNDSFELDYTPNRNYSLPVLANDQDVDEDTLTLVSAQSSLGEVIIENEALLLTLNSGVTGDINLSYLIVDPDGESSQAEVSLQIKPNDEALPILTVPEAVSVQAQGLFTRVDLGVAIAFDSKGEALPVSLRYGQPLFQPGRHLVYWETTDSNGNTKVASQQVDVYPLVNFHKDQFVVEGTSASVTLSLNGDSPQYPVVIDFTLEGDARVDEDYRLSSQQAVITSGRDVTLMIEILADNIDEPKEQLELVIDESVNRGYKPNHTLYIVNHNVAPEIAFEISQASDQRQMLGIDGGEIIITAKYSDINSSDQLTLSWNLNTMQVQDLDPSTDVIRFDPIELEPGYYPIRAEVSDGVLGTQVQANLHLVASLPTLDNTDTDGDMIPDNFEGFGDDDLDGVPNFQDALPSCNVQPENVDEQVQYLTEGEAGVCINVGSIATGGQRNTLLLDEDDALPEDSEFRFSGGVFDFVASGLPVQGNQYRIVLPLTKAIPTDAIYRKYSETQGWYDFVQDEFNQLHSSLGEPGYCPSPGDLSWQTGLIEGSWCIQLTIVDGGPNDDDGEANFHITDPGGVATINTSNLAPHAEDDIVVLIESSLLLLDPTLNDSDPEGGNIQLLNAQGRLGAASINQAGLLQYQAPAGYLGEDEVHYTIIDREGNSATARVLITVKANKMPVTVNDHATTDDRTSIVVDVISNDIDEQVLQLIYVDAEIGKVGITANDQLQYTPQLGYEGEDQVLYRIQDPLGAQMEGILIVTVDAYQIIEVKNESSGGSMGLFSAALLLLLGALRRSKGLISLLSVSLIFCGAAHAQWSVNAQSGYSRTSSDVDISQLESLGLLVDQFSNNNRDWSWSLGIDYEVVPNWQVNLGYQNLGNYEFSVQGEALSLAPIIGLASTLGPRSATGIDLGLSYRWEVSDSIGLMLGGGFWFWESDFTSLINQTRVSIDENGSDWFSDISVYWRIAPQWQIDLGWQRFIIDKNHIDNGFARISFMF